MKTLKSLALSAVAAGATLGFLALSAPVRRVEQRDDRVVVTCDRGTVVAERVIVAGMPKLRAAMHLDTVFTFADRDCVTVYPDITNGIRTFSAVGTSSRGLSTRPWIHFFWAVSWMCMYSTPTDRQ
mgnify:CR=1 FL=1